MEMRKYLSLLKRRWWLLVAGPALALLATFFITNKMTPQYAATSQLLVVNQAVSPELSALTGIDALEVDERITNTYVNLIERRPILTTVITNLGLVDTTVEDLQKKISVSDVKDTQLINVRVEDPDPALAASIANLTVQTFVTSIDAQLGKPGAVIIAEQATAAKEPFSPNLKTNLMLAALLGLMLAGGIAVALEYLDDTVKTAEDLEPLGLTSLGMISRFRGQESKGGKKGPLEVSDFNSRTAEAYRQLRTNIRFTSLGSGLKTIVITSSSPGEGKSTTASNLAAVLAQAGDRVILVDADLRRSSLRKTFDSPSSFGLTGLLYNDIQDPSVALVNTRWKNLRLLPAGVLPPNPSELLTSARMLRVIEALRSMADYVIFDTPPVLAVTDAIVLAARTDGTILVTEAHRTRTESLRIAARLIEQANARIAGVVLNRVKVNPAGYYYYRDEEVDNQVEIEADPRRAASAAAPAAPVAPAAQQPVMPARVAAPTPPPAAPKPVAPKVEPKPANLKPPSSEELLRRHLGGSSMPLPATGNGNGHSNGNGHNNGTNGSGESSGNGRHLVGAVSSSSPMETAALSGSVADMLSRMDETMDLIRSLRPGSDREEPRGV